MRRTISAALAAVTLTIVVAGPALAAKPFVRTVEDSGTFTIECGTVTLVEEYRQSAVVTMWFDADSNLARAHARVQFDGTITGPGSTLRLSETGRFTSFLDVGPDGVTERQIGLVYKFSAPGLGVVAQEIGNLTFFPDGTFKASGPHDVFDNDDRVEPLICPLFE